jgi:hypothetical protein
VDANTRAMLTALVDPKGRTVPDPLPWRQAFLILLPFLAMAAIIAWLMLV